MIFTLDKLRTFTRSIDRRLDDVIAYPDSWIDERIEEGMATTQDEIAIFSATETYNVENDFKVLGLEKVEIIPQLEVASMHSVECDITYFGVEETANNHVILTKDTTKLEPEDWLVTIRYYYYPVMPFTEIEMTMEMYKAVKEGIAVATYKWLKDNDQKQYHLGELKRIARTGIFDLEKDLLDIPEDRLWSGSWI